MRQPTHVDVRLVSSCWSVPDVFVGPRDVHIHPIRLCTLEPRTARVPLPCTKCVRRMEVLW